MLRRVLAFFGLAWKKDLNEAESFCIVALQAALNAQAIARDVIRDAKYDLQSTTDNTPRQ